MTCQEIGHLSFELNKRVAFTQRVERLNSRSNPRYTRDFRLASSQFTVACQKEEPKET